MARNVRRAQAQAKAKAKGPSSPALVGGRGGKLLFVLLLVLLCIGPSFPAQQGGDDDEYTEVVGWRSHYFLHELADMSSAFMKKAPGEDDEGSAGSLSSSGDDESQVDGDDYSYAADDQYDPDTGETSVGDDEDEEYLDEYEGGGDDEEAGDEAEEGDDEEEEEGGGRKKRFLQSGKSAGSAGNSASATSRAAAARAEQKARAARARATANRARQKAAGNADHARVRTVARSRAAPSFVRGGKVTRAPISRAKTRAALTAAKSRIQQGTFGTGSTARAPVAANKNGGRGGVRSSLPVNRGAAPTVRLSPTNRKRGGGTGLKGGVRGKKGPTLRPSAKKRPWRKTGNTRRLPTRAPTRGSDDWEPILPYSGPPQLKPTRSPAAHSPKPSGPIPRPSRRSAAPSRRTRPSSPSSLGPTFRPRTPRSAPPTRARIRPTRRPSPRPSFRPTAGPTGRTSGPTHSPPPTTVPTPRPSTLAEGIQEDTAGKFGSNGVGSVTNPAMPIGMPAAGTLLPPRNSVPSVILPTWPFYLPPSITAQTAQTLQTRFGLSDTEVQYLFLFLCRNTCTGRLFLSTATQQVALRLLNGARNLSTPISAQRLSNAQWISELVEQFKLDPLSFNLMFNRAVRTALMTGLLRTQDKDLTTPAGVRQASVQMGLSQGMAMYDERLNCANNAEPQQQGGGPSLTSGPCFRRLRRGLEEAINALEVRLDFSPLPVPAPAPAPAQKKEKKTKRRERGRRRLQTAPARQLPTRTLTQSPVYMSNNPPINIITGFATPEPSARPSSHPTFTSSPSTRTPTRRPTRRPSPAPTRRPTSNPTHTAAPSAAPSPKPSLSSRPSSAAERPANETAPSSGSSPSKPRTKGPSRPTAAPTQSIMQELRDFLAWQKAHEGRGGGLGPPLTPTRALNSSSTDLNNTSPSPSPQSPPSSQPTTAPTLITQNPRVVQLPGVQVYLSAQYNLDMVGMATKGRVQNWARIMRIMSTALQDRAVWERALRSAAAASVDPVITALVSDVSVVEVLVAQPKQTTASLTGMRTAFRPTPRPTWTPPNMQPIFEPTRWPSRSAWTLMNTAPPSAGPTTRPRQPTPRPSVEPTAPSARPSVRPSPRPSLAPTSVAPTMLPTRRTFAPWKPPSPPSPEPTMTLTNSPTIAVNAASAGAAAGSMSSSTLTSVIVVAVLIPILALVIYYFCLSGRAKAARAAKDKARAAKEFMMRAIAEEEALERGRGGGGDGGGGGGGGVGVDEMRISLHEFYSSKGNSAARIAAVARKNDRRNSALPSSSSYASASPPGPELELTRAADYVQRMDAFTPAPAPSGGRRESSRGGPSAPAPASASAPAPDVSEGGRRYKFEPLGGAAAMPLPPTPPSAPKRMPKPLLTQTHARASALLDAEHKWEH